MNVVTIEQSAEGGMLVTEGERGDGPAMAARPRSYSDILPLDPEWLWEGRIPLGELTVLAAKGGTGKTFAACDLAARVTRGDVMPDGSPGGPPGSVVIASAEDDPATVMVHRLTAARADLDRVHDLSEPGGVPFTVGGPDDCLPALRKLIAAAGDVRAVILDPLAGVSAIPLTSVTRVRRELMRPLQTLARDTGCAVVAIHHLTKAGDVAGSRAVVDTARSVLLATRGDDGIRTITVLKSNLARDTAEPVRYRIAGAWPDTAAEWIPAEDDPRAGREGGPAQARVLMALRSSAAPRTGQQLAAMTGLPYGSVRVVLHKLARRALVASPARGLYVARQMPADPLPAGTEQPQVSALRGVN